jgi:predicted transcriptional regulator
MLVIKKIRDWCLKNWKALGIALGGLAAFLIGSKRQKDKADQSNIERDLYKKESKAIQLARRRENAKLIKAEIKYQKALEDLEKKYDDKNSQLIREKDHIYKQMLEEVKDDPKELNNFLNALGINEVKK